jgi:muconate cycloisomerase
MAPAPVQCDIYRTAIPMRRFEHAAASREAAEAVVVGVAFADGRRGWGETLPREYVTGETLDGAAADLAGLLWPALLAAWRAEAAWEELSAAIPDRAADGRCLNAAACALELAALESAAAAGRPVAACPVRASGVLGSRDPSRTARRLRLMRWYGLRDFKLKLGLGEEVDAENLGIVRGRLGRAVARGKCTLRVDVNGGWAADEAAERAAALKPLGVCVVEQPVRCSAAELADIARRCDLPLMADESLLTADDARDLLPAGDAVWWNVRLSKNGGMLRSLRLARMAAENGIPFVAGCMVGESSILAAAQRRMLAAAPRPRFVESGYARFLLADDLTRERVSFGWGGRLKGLRDGVVEIDERRLSLSGALVRTLRA